MISSGLVSITFRALTPAQVIALVREAGLRGIEWGGDIHVPHGNAGRARETRELTLEAGLEVAAYGSYYRAGQSEGAGLPFEAVLESATELGAPTLRVWAGSAGSVTASDDDRARVVNDLRRIAEMAKARRITVSLEFHNGTLADTAESTARLLSEVAHPNLFTYWQPPVDRDDEGNRADLQGLLPQVTNLHVFEWKRNSTERRPLADGAERWGRFLEIARHDGKDRYAMIEFVEADAPANFLRDARALKTWLGN